MVTVDLINSTLVDKRKQPFKFIKGPVNVVDAAHAA